jgi:hypothetical protein
MAPLKDLYDRFSAQPSSADLVDDGADARLTYVTSGTTIRGADEIVQFLARSQKEVQLTETVLVAHTAHDSLTLEVAAECKFKNGGSWIAPGIEANLIDGVVIKIALVPNTKNLMTGSGTCGELTCWGRLNVSRFVGIRFLLFGFIGIRLLF